jgi:NAD(P)-dependent dehydrogenase (short-subunit alcohol dehydrogenase family)
MDAIRALSTSRAIAQHLGPLTQRVFLITGASNGLGLEMAKALAGAQATVVLACRAGAKASAALAAVRAEPGALPASVHLLDLDLASLDSVRACAGAFTNLHLPLHALVCNAGINGVPTWGAFSPGLESTLAVNFLGHYLLHSLLRPALSATPGARCVILSSESHRRVTEALPTLAAELPPPVAAYDSLRAYAFSNLARTLWTRAEGSRAPYPVVCLHPAVVGGTGMMRHMGAWDAVRQVCLALWHEVGPSNGLQGWEQGSRLQTYLALAPVAALTSGAYYSGNRCHVFGEPLATSPQAARDDLAAELVAWAEDYLAKH